MQKLLSNLALAMAVLTGMALAPFGSVKGATCPATPFGGTNADNCNLDITFAGNGSITTAIPPGATLSYDSGDDAVIGVYNNTHYTLRRFNISGIGTEDSIFSGMDGDGIDTYSGVVNAAAGLSDPKIAPVCNASPQPPCGADDYGGADAYFTHVTFAPFGAPESGTVNFLFGIAPGATDYFSLESFFAAPPTVTLAPEPASLMLLGASLAAVGFVRRR
jgi:hypothetical protein